MKECNLEDLPAGRDFDSTWDDAAEIVNLDVKVENILLGYPDHRAHTTILPAPSCGGTKKYDYPVIKVVDFGECAITSTSASEQENPIGLFERGTNACQPPEMIHYGCLWPDRGCENANYHVDRPADETAFLPDMSRTIHEGEISANQWDNFITGADYNFKLLEKVHVWAIGKALFEAVVLDAQHLNIDGQHQDMYWHASTFSYKEFSQNGDYQLSDFTVEPFRNYFRASHIPYSEELLELVEACLRPKVSARIDIETLKRRTSMGMREWDAEWTAGCENNENSVPKDVQDPKLYYKENEINLMPEGRYEITNDYNLYRKMQQEASYHPDWVRLHPIWNNQYIRQDQYENSWRQDEEYPNNFTHFQNEYVTTIDNNNQRQVVTRAQAINQRWTIDPAVPSPTSTEDPSDPGVFRLQIHKGRRGRNLKATYKFNSSIVNPNSDATKARLATKNQISKVRTRNINHKFHEARSRNAVRRPKEREAIQRRRPRPIRLNVGGGQPPPPPPAAGSTFLQTPQAQSFGSSRVAPRLLTLPIFLRNPPAAGILPQAPPAGIISELLQRRLAHPWQANNPDEPAERNHVFEPDMGYLAAAQLIPVLPPGVLRDDLNLYWDRAAQHYIYDYEFRPFWWSASDHKWFEVEEWPDTPENRALGRVGPPRIRGTDI